MFVYRYTEGGGDIERRRRGWGGIGSGKQVNQGIIDYNCIPEPETMGLGLVVSEEVYGVGRLSGATPGLWIYTR